MNEYVARLGKLYAKNLFYLSPKNIIQEKKRFFSAYKKGKEYNPQFSYPLFRAQLKPFKAALKILAAEGICKKLQHRYKEKTAALISMYEALQTGKDIAQKDTRTFYGFPSTHAVSIAKHQLQIKTKSRPKTPLPFKEVRRRMIQELKPYGWKLETTMMPTKAKVVISQQILYLNPHRTFSQKDVERLIVHEIHAHVQRAYNHRKWSFPCKELLDSTALEEGLAYYLEEQQGVQSIQQMRIYAARLLGTYYNKKSFYDLFCMFRRYKFSEEKAFTIATRVKRGTHDSALPGGLTKDHTYLSGKLDVEHYIQNGGDISTLLRGRFGLHELPLVNKFI